jgi:Uma2 family endonuclease
VINSELLFRLKQLKGTCGNCDVVYELDWIIDENTVLRPDIVVVCNQHDKFITKPPVLIVEVLSPATALKDRHLKYEIYEEQGVRYYVITDPETKQFNIFELSNGQYQEHNDIHTFIIENECSIVINLEELLAAI